MPNRFHRRGLNGLKGGWVFFTKIQLNIQDTLPARRPSPALCSWALSARSSGGAVPPTRLQLSLPLPRAGRPRRPRCSRGAGSPRERKAAGRFFSRVSEKTSCCSPPIWAKGCCSLFAFSHADSSSSLPFAESLLQFISLMLGRPVGISCNCPSPRVDQDKSSDEATRRQKKNQPVQNCRPDAFPRCGCRGRRAAQPLAALQKVGLLSRTGLLPPRPPTLHRTVTPATNNRVCRAPPQHEALLGRAPSPGSSGLVPSGSVPSGSVPSASALLGAAPRCASDPRTRAQRSPRWEPEVEDTRCDQHLRWPQLHGVAWKPFLGLRSILAALSGGLLPLGAGTGQGWTMRRRGESLPAEIAAGAGKSSWSVCVLSCSVSMGRGERWSGARSREASVPHASTKPAASHPHGKGEGNRSRGGRQGGDTLHAVPNQTQPFQQGALPVGEGREHGTFTPSCPTRRDTPCATLPSHAAGFPRARTGPPLSPGIRAGNVGEKFSESRCNPAAGCPRRHPGTSSRLTQRVVRGRPMAPAGNTDRAWRCVACCEGRSFDELSRGKNL